MHDLGSRISGVFSFVSSVLAAQMALIGIYHSLRIHNGPVAVVNDLSVSRVSYNTEIMRGTGHWYHGRAQVIAANVSLDIDAGKLRPVLSYFGWNTKMIFASVLVDFASPTSNENQIVCWDDIILESEDAVMSYKDLNCESWTQIFDAAKTLDGAKGDLILRYQVIPWVGVMHTFSVVVKDKVDFSAAPKPRQKQPAKPKKARS